MTERVGAMKKWISLAAAAAACMTLTTGCSRTVKTGDKAGYDEGEQYLSLWVHIIEETPEGQAYLESVNSFNEHYNGRYFADVEFIPRNDSGHQTAGRKNKRSYHGSTRRGHKA